jgi:hypothetical protein
VKALAAMLRKPSGREEREASAPADEAVKERMAAFGYDAAEPATLAKWQELGRKVDAGRITEKDRLRAMTQYLWEQGDKERRDRAREALTRKQETERDVGTGGDQKELER